jgi:cyclopropane-fatty-acyl-phospholipid synthase
VELRGRHNTENMPVACEWPVHKTVNSRSGGRVAARPQASGGDAAEICAANFAPRAPAAQSRRVMPLGLALLASLLRRFIAGGTLTLIDPHGRSHEFGDGGSRNVIVRICTREAIRRLALNPALAVGETYVNGELRIESGTLDDFLGLCTIAMDRLEQHPLMALWRKMFRPFRILQQQNGRKRAAKNISDHYDLSGRLYDLFLDRDRQYSCAYFRRRYETLEIAQANKKRLIAAKLCLKPGMKVLDIGSGWGGLAIDLAQSVPHLQVTGLTLSREQLDVSQSRAREAGLADRVTFYLRDYRDEIGQYDRVVSVGMFEHVGISNYPDFFEKLKRLLKPEGIALLHAIGRMEAPTETNSWIRKYIFPGGYCPALSEVLAPIERSRLWVTDIEILRLHYARTLQEWASRFQSNRDRVAAIYDERFCRMWEFYLASAEAAFLCGRLMVFQMQLTNSRDAAPLTRDYLTGGISPNCIALNSK